MTENVIPLGDRLGPCKICGQAIHESIHEQPHGFVTAVGAVTHRWERADTAAGGIPTPEKQIDVMAGDLVGALRMWDLTRDEAAEVLKRARRLCKTAESWANPLQGTGVKPIARGNFSDETPR